MSTTHAIRHSIAARVAEMPAYEDRFWRIVHRFGGDRTQAVQMLDRAVEWIEDGHSDVVDPYLLALSWLPRVCEPHGVVRG